MSIDRFILNKISLGKKSICLCLTLKDNSKSLILDAQNVYYFLSSFCNIMSLVLLNKSEIFYDNK